jgi:hypothetical protein
VLPISAGRTSPQRWERIDVAEGLAVIETGLS